MLFTLGLLAKPMLVTLPPLLVLLDFWPLARFGAAGDTPAWAQSAERPSVMRLVLEKLPLFALAAGDCLMTLRTHVHGEPLSWSMRIGNAAISCVTYVVQFFYPVDLAAFYPYPTGGLPTWKVAGALAILAIVSAAVVICRRRCPYLFVGWFWYLGMLVPVLGLVRVADHTMADRYMYLPGIGLSIALAWGATRLVAGSLAGRWGLATCAGLAIAALVALAARQTSFWRDDETLWRHAMTCTTDNDKAETGVADALRGRAAAMRQSPFIALLGNMRPMPRRSSTWARHSSAQGNSTRPSSNFVTCWTSLPILSKRMPILAWRWQVRAGWTSRCSIFAAPSRSIPPASTPVAAWLTYC